MKTDHRLISIALALALVFVAACGSDDDIDQIECGEGTELDEAQEQCVSVDVECDEGLVHDAVLGRCVRSGDAYCAEGTELDEDLGQCVADADLECAENTLEDEGTCLPDLDLECGPGTVVHGAECAAADEVCGDKTDGDPCRPTDAACGQGTVFDTDGRVCIPASTLSCGPSTVASEGLCIPTFTFYDDLAQNPDIDMTEEGADGAFELAATGERVVFVGTINAPHDTEDGPVQDMDVYHFDAPAGQWLEITVFSLGLPEPGFLFEDLDSEFYRLSDIGAGIEVSRQVAIGDDGSFELTVTNMPQLMDWAPLAGGDDWDYVGYVETMDTPEPTSVDIFDEDISGDIRDLSDNFYALDEMGAVESLLLLFNAIPSDADAELQIWSDATTLDETLPLGSDSLSVVPPADSFYLLLDRVHVFGADTDYAISGVDAVPLDAGDSTAEEISLSAGDYVGVFQFNEDGASLQASISANSDTLATTNELAISTATEGQNSLYWYTDTDTTVTVEVANNSGADIASFSSTIVTGSADHMEIEDDTLHELSIDKSLTRGQRHYVELSIDTGEMLSLSIANTLGSARVGLQDEDGNLLAEGTNAVVFEQDPGEYRLFVEARDTISDGFTLTSEELQIFTVSETSDPNLAIPDNDPSGVDDVIVIDSCPTVTDINMDIDITHTFRGDLILRLTDPGGNEVLLKDASGLENDLVGNLNETLDPVGGEPIDTFVGTSGSGSWTLNVSDNATIDTGTLNSWTLNMTCEG